MANTTGIRGTIEEFLTISQPAQIDYSYLIIALLTAIVLSFILGKLYVVYGTSISNRKKFSHNFALLATTTTLIIMIVKSSLALSLGLVGALSIVRFRAAFKEPEELAFLFFVIAIGLGLGAGQLTITLISFVIISLLIYGRHKLIQKGEDQNLYLTISGSRIKLPEIISILKKYSSSLSLKRFDQVEKDIEVSFLIDFDSFEEMNKAREELNKLSPDIKISYLDKISFY